MLAIYCHATVLPQTYQPKTMHIVHLLARLSWVLCKAEIRVLDRVAVLSEVQGSLPSSLKLLTAVSSWLGVRPRPQFLPGLDTQPINPFHQQLSMWQFASSKPERRERETPVRWGSDYVIMYT